MSVGNGPCDRDVRTPPSTSLVSRAMIQPAFLLREVAEARARSDGRRGVAPQPRSPFAGGRYRARTADQHALEGSIRTAATPEVDRDDDGPDGVRRPAADAVVDGVGARAARPPVWQRGVCRSRRGNEQERQAADCPFRGNARAASPPAHHPRRPKSSAKTPPPRRRFVRACPDSTMRPSTSNERAGGRRASTFESRCVATEHRAPGERGAKDAPRAVARSGVFRLPEERGRRARRSGLSVTSARARGDTPGRWPPDRFDAAPRR